MRMRPAITRVIPPAVASKIRVVDYLCYVDDDFFNYSALYDKARRRGIGGFKEPWEKMNFMSFFVMRKYMKDNNIPLAGLAEADVAVLVPPALPTGCDSEISWRYYWSVVNKEPWKHFTYDAIATNGNVVSLDLLSDFLSFLFEVYGKEELFWLLKARADNYIMRVTNQMYHWYMYAMTSVDKHGLPWSDGKPWELQYKREPPDFERRTVVYPKDPKYANRGFLPPTRRYKLCNGWFPRDNFVFDQGKGFQGNGHWTYDGGPFRINTSSGKITAYKGVARYMDLHFQGESKGAATSLLKPLLPFRLNLTR